MLAEKKYLLVVVCLGKDERTQKDVDEFIRPQLEGEHFLRRLLPNRQNIRDDDSPAFVAEFVDVDLWATDHAVVDSPATAYT